MATTPTIRRMSDYAAEHQVRDHNTMRFDVALAHINPMIMDGEVDVAKLADRIQEAIDAAVDEVVGAGLDGTPIPGGCTRVVYPDSNMLRRESLQYDLS